MTGGAQLYVIGGDGLPHVKIGTSINPQKRLRQLQPGSPIRLTVLWTTPGDSTLERQVHARFDAYRSYGEWFDLTPLGDPPTAVQEAVRALLTTGCIDPESCYGGPCMCVARRMYAPDHPLTIA